MLSSPALSVVSLLALVACATRSRPSVLLITIDTLRADRLGCYGYEGAETPNLDRLASEGVLFEQVGAQVPVTLPSHATILTGLTPAAHGVHDNGTFHLPDEVSTLAELLAPRKYRTAAFIGAYVLARPFGVSQGFGVYEDFFPESDQPGDRSHFAQRPASEVAELGIRWLVQHGKDPFFLWLHLFDPHTPYTPPPPYEQRFAGRPYDGEIAYVDHEVGRVLGCLAEQGMDRSTIVVVTSDHGEGLGQHGEPDHSNFVYESTMRVPLILRWPGRIPRGVRIGALARTLDVAPTILALVDVPVPAWMEGSNLIPLLEGAEPTDTVSIGESMLPLYHFGLSPLVSVRTTRWKYIAAPRPELYDLADDPAETKNLIEVVPDVARHLSRAALHYTSKLGGGNAGRHVPDEELRKLATLGYVASAPPVTRRPDEWAKLDDPKDHARRLVTVKRAARLIGTGDVNQGLRLLEQTGADAPGIPLVQYLKGWGLFLLGRFDEAAEVMNEGMALDSSYVEFPKMLGRVELARGNPARAVEVLDRAHALNPEDPHVLRLKGQAFLAQGLPREALPSLEAAYGLQPSLWTTRFLLTHALLAVGRPDSALHHATAALPHSTHPEEVHLLMGRCNEALGRWQEAGLAYRRALALDTTLAGEHRRMALCYHRAGMEDSADAILAEHLARYGENSTVLSLLAAGRLATGDTGWAVSTYGRAVTLDSTNVAAWAGLMSIAAARGDTAAVGRLVTQALGACPDDSSLAALARRLAR